ncbi:hypothetical protein JOQ06_027562 [Pogonophryne albipinna]|uniref:Ig-like domain-containing protein n=1 Tax=Pogonophryne albipinna TaxID=1090488 RepID=A0AAD6FNT4_9TELE|nr:hypothetical protein JOQ06_027562 [Pogonophryne albipinna]
MIFICPAEPQPVNDDAPPADGDSDADGDESGNTSLSGLFVEKPPEAIVGVAGTDLTIIAKVDSTTLTRKPTMKWLKGKWMDLGSKAGKHMQFKETYDRNTKIYTYEMKIIKLVAGDSGGFRCEVTAKDKCDSSTFQISVEAAQQDTQQADILSAFKRADGGEDDGNLDFSALLKATKKKKIVEIPEIDVWELLKNAHPSEYEKIAFEYGITDLRGMLKRLKKMKVVAPKNSEAFLKRLDSCYSVEKGKKIVLRCEVVDPDVQVKWLKNGQEIKPSAKYIMECLGNVRTLAINRASLADDAAYECVVGEDKCFTEVFVKEPPVTITKLMDDYHVVVGERVEFEIEVSEEGAHVMWFFEDIELATLNDIGMYHAWTNGGHTKGELEVEEKQLEVLQDIADLTVRATDQALFKCEVSDEKVTGKWFKDGVEVVESDRIKMTHIGRFHRLLIDNVKPEDAGDYTFIPDGYALSISAKLNFLEIKVDYVPRQDPPKIHLDTTGNMVSQNTIIVVAGNKLRLDVEITGEPAPTCVWTKGDKQITESEGRIRVEARKT